MELKYCKKDYYLMILAFAISTFGSAITWTGLPIFMAKITGNINDSSTLFITETLAGIIFTILGGDLADRISRKKIGIASSLICGLLMFFLFFQLNPKNNWVFYVVSTLCSIAGALSSASLSAWLSSIIEDMEKTLEIGLGKKNTIMIATKMTGMASGPLLFEFIGKYALLLDAATFFAEVIVLIFVMDHFKPSKIEKRNWKDIRNEYFDLFTYLRNNSRIKGLMAISGISGILSFPIINACIFSLKSSFNAPAFMISSFWLFSASGSLISNFLISKGIFERLSKKKLFFIANFGMALALTSMSFATGPYLLIASFIGFTLTNPIINNFLSAELFRSANKSYQGRIIAIDFTISDLTSMLALLIFINTNDIYPMPLGFLFLVPFTIFRIFLGHPIFQEANEKSKSIGKEYIVGSEA